MAHLGRLLFQLRVLQVTNLFTVNSIVIDYSDDYIVPVHIPHGMDPKQKINAPAFYLLNQYLKVKATELFEVAHREGLPVLQTGRYQNLTHNINVSMF